MATLPLPMHSSFRLLPVWNYTLRLCGASSAFTLCYPCIKKSSRLESQRLPIYISSANINFSQFPIYFSNKRPVPISADEHLSSYFWRISLRTAIGHDQWQVRWTWATWSKQACFGANTALWNIVERLHPLPRQMAADAAAAETAS